MNIDADIRMIGEVVTVETLNGFFETGRSRRGQSGQQIFASGIGQVPRRLDGFAVGIGRMGGGGVGHGHLFRDSSRIGWTRRPPVKLGESVVAGDRVDRTIPIVCNQTS